MNRPRRAARAADVRGRRTGARWTLSHADPPARAVAFGDPCHESRRVRHVIVDPDRRRRDERTTSTRAAGTDAELLRRSSTDAGAFRELYDRHAVAVHAFHLRRCRDPHAAQDLTAETFAQAWLSRGRFRDGAGGSAGPWLFGIARNVLRVSVRPRRIEAEMGRRQPVPAAGSDSSQA